MKYAKQKSPAVTPARKTLLTALLLAGAIYGDIAAAASLPSGAILNITSGAADTNSAYSGVGSYFGMDTSATFGNISATEKTPIISTGGIIIGSVMLASGSHTGPNNGSESPAFDIWVFGLNTGMHYLRTAATDNGNGTLAWSGWTVTWNAIPSIDMGTNAFQPGNCGALGCTGWTFDNGIARFQWAGTSGGVWSALNGTSYTLDYSATVPNDSPNFANVKYYLHLVGTVTLPNFALVDDTPVAKTATLKNLDVITNDTQTSYTIGSGSLAIATSPSQGGTATANGNTIDYTSASGFTGTETFTYTLTSNGIISSPATVTVTVSSVSPPTATADSATVNGTTAATISVLTNDTGGDFSISASTVAISTLASHGIATANPSGTVTYTATSGFSGVDTFKYTVNDTASNTSNAATVSVTVRATAPASASGTLTPGDTATAAGSTTGGGLTTSNVGTDSALSQQCVGGCSDFRVAGLSSGGTVNVVLPLSATIPASAVYRKLVSGAWQDFSTATASGNAIASAAAISTSPAVVCPQAGSSSYTSGLTEGNQCIQLTIVEGGANDEDGTANGTVLDPGGVGVKGTSVDIRSGATGGCSLGSNQINLKERGDWGLVALFLGWLGLVIRRRQHRA